MKRGREQGPKTRGKRFLKHRGRAQPHLESKPQRGAHSGKSRGGEEFAVGELERSLDSYRSLVQGWATGRLPGWAREGVDTSDLVQVTLLRAWSHLDTFRGQREQAFRAYLRRILENEIIDRVRCAGRRPPRVELTNDLPDPNPTALDAVIQEEFAETYRQMLNRLGPRRRQALFLRFEDHLAYEQIGRILGIKANAARMRVARALEEITAMLAEDMDPSPGRPA